MGKGATREKAGDRRGHAVRSNSMEEEADFLVDVRKGISLTGENWE